MRLRRVGVEGAVVRRRHAVSGGDAVMRYRGEHDLEAVDLTARGERGDARRGTERGDSSMPGRPECRHENRAPRATRKCR